MSLAIYRRTVRDAAGAVQSGAAYTVVSEATGTDIAIYSDRAGLTLMTPPYSTDSNGQIKFFVPAGITFRVTVTGGSGSFTDNYAQGLLLTESTTDTDSGKLIKGGDDVFTIFGLGTAAAADIGTDPSDVPTNGDLYVDSIADLPTVVVDQQINAAGYHAGTTVGGDKFKGVASARHDGIINFDPSRSAEIGTAAYYVDSGIDVACWVRSKVSVISLYDFGYLTDADTFVIDAAKNWRESNTNEASVFKINENLTIGEKPLPFTASVRDAFQVSRNINGKTDCHAFADKTTIQNATDGGSYGTFDSQTEVDGSHTQNHQYSFQDRAKYSGSGVLKSWGNIIWPEKNGTGTVDLRQDIEIKDVAGGGGGSITSHIGLYIRNLSRAVSNAAINLEQSSGYAVYAPNAGKWQIGGDFAVTSGAEASFGLTTPVSGAPISWKSVGATQTGFATSNASSAGIGVNGDYSFQVVTNSNARFVIDDSSNIYAVRPGTNNFQSLGTAAYRWTEVYAANGTINTSDEREKQQIEELNESEIRVAKKLKSLIRKFKFNKAVGEKGDKARTHVGVIAQQVQAAFESEGLDAFAYGVLCVDKWGETTEVVETDELHPDAYAVVSEIPKIEIIEVPIKSVKIVNGEPVMSEEIQKIEKPVTVPMAVMSEGGEQIFEDALEQNEKGETVIVKIPLTHEVPVTEEKIKYYRKAVKPAGELYGVRYEQLLAFIIAGL